MGSRRGYRAEREQTARHRPGEKTPADGPVEAVLRLQRTVGNRAVADQVQIARQGTTAPQKAPATVTIESEALGTLSFPIRSWYESPTGGRTISVPHLDSDVELKLQKAQKEHLVLDEVNMVDGEAKAMMRGSTSRTSPRMPTASFST